MLSIVVFILSTVVSFGVIIEGGKSVSVGQGLPVVGG